MPPIVPPSPAQTSRHTVLTPTHSWSHHSFLQSDDKRIMRNLLHARLVQDFTVYWSRRLLLFLLPPPPPPLLSLLLLLTFVVLQRPVKPQSKSCGTLPTPRSSWGGTKSMLWRMSQKWQDIRYKRSERLYAWQVNGFIDCNRERQTVTGSIYSVWALTHISEYPDLTDEWESI